ncbi:hypothetical protein XENOCAPTIV_024061, partial [Xenoophorus captivus]
CLTFHILSVQHYYSELKQFTSPNHLLSSSESMKVMNHTQVRSNEMKIPAGLTLVQVFNLLSFLLNLFAEQIKSVSFLAQHDSCSLRNFPTMLLIVSEDEPNVAVLF